MSTEREVKFLSKRQTKRNIDKQVHNLLVECKWNEADNFILDVHPQSCTSHSINALDKNLNLDQNFNLSPDLIYTLNTQQQHNELDRESIYEISNASDRPDRLYNITPEIFEETCIEETCIKQLLTHFRLTKMSHVENVPQIPVDSSKHLDNLEKFLDIRENFDYMVSIKILNVLSVRLTFL